jgi:polyhydroxyalkanoate synthase
LIVINEFLTCTDKETMVFPTGHIGIFVGSKSQKEVCPKIATWLKPRSILTAKEKTLEQNVKKRKSTVNKK